MRSMKSDNIGHLRLPLGEDKLWAPEPGLSLRPEEAVAHTIERNGARLQWCEGGGINLLMKAACLDLLVDKLFPSDREAAVRRYFEAQCKLLERSRSEIVERIRTVSPDDLLSGIQEICASDVIRSYYPRVRPEFLVQLHRSLGNEALAGVAAVFVEDPYAYRAGWPDLIVLDATGVSFVEVKTTDKLHESQLRFAVKVAARLGLRCKVVRLRAAS